MDSHTSSSQSYGSVHKHEPPEKASLTHAEQQPGAAAKTETSRSLSGSRSLSDSDSLSKESGDRGNSKGGDREHDDHQELKLPDGGFGWVVVAASFAVHIVLMGVMYSFGVLYVELLRVFDEGSGVTAMVGSVQAGVFTGCAVFVGQIVARFGCRRCSLVASVVVPVGLLASSFAENIWQITLAYGVFSGAGFALAYTPSIVILGQWFEKKRGIATGIAVAGAGIGTLLYAPLVETIIQQFGWEWYMRIAAAIAFVTLFASGLCFRTPPNFDLIQKPQKVSGIVDLSLLKDPILLLMASTLVIAGFGYNTPITHIVKYAEEAAGISDTDAALLITYFGIGSTIGRVVLGYLADKFSVLYMFCISIFGAGAVQAFGFTYSTEGDFITFATLYGFLSGSFIALNPVLLAHFLGLRKFAQAFGLLNTLGTAGVFLGAPIAGWMRDAYGNYDYGFLLGGCLLMVSIVGDMCVPHVARKIGRKLGEMPEEEERRRSSSGSGDRAVGETKSLLGEKHVKSEGVVRGNTGSLALVV